MGEKANAMQAGGSLEHYQSPISVVWSPKINKKTAQWTNTPSVVRPFGHREDPRKPSGFDLGACAVDVQGGASHLEGRTTAML